MMKSCNLMSLAVAVALGVLSTARAADETVTVEVVAGDHDRQGVLVGVEVPEALRDAAAWTLQRVDTGKAIPVQRDPADSARAIWLVRDKLPAGQTRQYSLSAAPAKVSAEGGAEAKGGVTVADDGRRLLVRVGEKPVLAYNHVVVPSPDAEHPYYRRSGFIHPVYNPSGQVVTEGFPADHMHQHGLMFAWVNATWNGQHVDCWNQAAQEGTVEHVKVEATGGGPVLGSFTVRLRHVNLKTPDAPTPILNETWHVRVANLADHFLFDIESSQTCAGEVPFVVEEYHYGGMMVRGSKEWLGAARGDFLTSEGKTRRDGNHTRPRWCEIHGQLDGRPTGMTVMDHPDNFRFPQPVRLHPSMPYFCFSPMVLGSFTLQPGDKPYVSKYRFYVHDGQLDTGVAERLWHDYAEPPTVRIVPEP